ncbi:N-acetyltransferase family protein [Planktotalea sp.]|uniref:GNAT family N-acetyltransferase n=1 Tax=Planktotalea sp. TaxID=2029877 RepID=UPI003D6BE2A7
MKLRAAKTSDASSLAAISLEVWIGTYLKRGVDAFFADYALNTFTKANFEELINSAKEEITVAEIEQGIAGFSRLTLDSEAPIETHHKAEISTLYVQPRHQGKGFGKALLLACFGQCQNHGNPSVWLVTNAENSPAIAFYLACGFEKIGETQFTIQDQGYLNNVYARRIGEGGEPRK